MEFKLGIETPLSRTGVGQRVRGHVDNLLQLFQRDRFFLFATAFQIPPEVEDTRFDSDRWQACLDALQFEHNEPLIRHPRDLNR